MFTTTSDMMTVKLRIHIVPRVMTSNAHAECAFIPFCGDFKSSFAYGEKRKIPTASQRDTRRWLPSGS